MKKIPGDSINFLSLIDNNGNKYYFVNKLLFPVKTYLDYLKLDTNPPIFWEFLNTFSYRLKEGEVNGILNYCSVWCIHEWNLTRVWLIPSGFSPWEDDPGFEIVSWPLFLRLWLQGRIISYKKRHLYKSGIFIDD